MTAILQDLLLPSFVRDVISRVKLPARYLSRYFGWGWDGLNIGPRQSLETINGRAYTYDIYDNVRTVANARAPGATSGTVAPNSVGNNTVVLGRFAEKLPLDYNQLLAIRVLGKNAGDRDRMGTTYIDKQVMTLRQRAENVWEFITGALFNGGKYGYFFNGDDFVPTYDTANANVTVDLKIDTGNLGNLGGAFAATLQMGTGANIIDAAWSSIATDIITHVSKIDSAFQDLVGAPLEAIFVPSGVWNNVLQNTGIRNVTGSANQVNADFQQTNITLPDGTTLAGVRQGTLKPWPWIKWIVWDGSLKVAKTTPTNIINVKLLPPNQATFFCAGHNDGTWLKGIQGSEIVKDNDIAPPVERFGLYTWAMERADPARVWYHTLQNVGIELNIPKGIAAATVQ